MMQTFVTLVGKYVVSALKHAGSWAIDRLASAIAKRIPLPKCAPKPAPKKGGRGEKDQDPVG